MDSGLESVVLPRSLKAIGESAFFGCKSLRSVVLDTDSALEEIGPRAFQRSGLKCFAAT